jgi:predicted RecB family nuclease
VESDRLELAFYWSLLQPLRRGRPKPRGFILLNTGEVAEVVLNKEDFARLENLVKEIRLVKEIGCQPTICGECKICVLKEECLSEVYKQGGLSLVHGIASIRQKQLYELGIKDIHALASADAENLSVAWRELSPWAPGVLELKRMIIHAKSWIELRPIYFGKYALPVSANKIVLDLEYDPLSVIWLVGLLVISDQNVECHQFFAEGRSDERELLVCLIDLLSKYSNYQVLTWYGLGADLPQLKTAWQRHKLPVSKLRDLIERHVDLYQLTLDVCRLPLKSFGLKEVGQHLGFVRKHADIDGLLALSMYNQYLHLPKKNDEKRLSIKNVLLEYNREDLEATLFTLNQLKLLAATNGKSKPLTR